ncbi:hypothetical protein BT69DRAFT_920284 [Atractiella rhizophila]|nr:hypothetical protein BT69DRAFT_920284 [Atractiella rhizophila]
MSPVTEEEEDAPALRVSVRMRVSVRVRVWEGSSSCQSDRDISFLPIPTPFLSTHTDTPIPTTTSPQPTPTPTSTSTHIPHSPPAPSTPQRSRQLPPQLRIQLLQQPHLRLRALQLRIQRRVQRVEEELLVRQEGDERVPGARFRRRGGDGRRGGVGERQGGVAEGVHCAMMPMLVADQRK